MADDSFNPGARPDYFDYLHAKDLVATEREYLRKRPGRRDGAPYVGLALSGGGMRSASFALGLLQSLARNDRLREIDYLSTVSGGGYIGSSLTWFLHRPWPYSTHEPHLEFGVSPHDFPFAAATGGKDEREDGNRMKKSILRHLRQNLNYLFPGDGIGPMALVAALLRGATLNVIAYGPLFLVVLILFALAGMLMSLYLPFPGFVSAEDAADLEYLQNWVPAAGYILLLLMLSAPVYGVVTFFVRSRSRLVYAVHRFYVRLAGRALILTGLLVLLGVLPLVVQNWGTASAGGAGFTVAGFLSALWAHARTFYEKARVFRIPTNVVVGTAATLLTFGIFLLGYGAASVVAYPRSIGSGFDAREAVMALAVVAVFGVVMGLMANINLVTLHRFYRDRLMELFMPVPVESTIDKPAQPARTADSTRLHEMCNYWTGRNGPYHLINTNVLLSGSKVTKFRGRGGDSFILSPLYCGSNATGWVRTDRFMDGKFTLATSMAISGAAVTAHAGAAGEGPARNPLLGALMALFNIRLGVWVENPSKVSRHFSRKGKPPNLWNPGLKEIVLHRRMNEEADFVELTDGGHFENLAVYELVRREVDLIIVCDGVADRDSRFADFANLVEKIRLDFQATVDIDLDPLVPREGEHPYAIGKMSAASHALGTITYRSGKKGVIAYVGTTLVCGLPADLYGYKLAHDDFPDETTADQVFDEKQFEAYRELGNQLGDRLVAAIEDHCARPWPARMVLPRARRTWLARLCSIRPQPRSSRDDEART